MNFDIRSINYPYLELNKKKWRCRFTNSSTLFKPLSTNIHFHLLSINFERMSSMKEMKIRSVSSFQSLTQLSKFSTFFNETDLIDRHFSNWKNIESNNFQQTGYSKFSRTKLYKLKNQQSKVFKNFLYYKNFQHHENLNLK